MNGPGTIEYRCRRCGAIERSLHTPNVLVTVSELAVHGVASSFPGNPCDLVSTHGCEDGGIGISDAIVGVPDPKVTS